MPNQEFPMSQYLQAFQNKYANEQANKPNFGKIIGEGMSQGAIYALQNSEQEKSKRKERVFEATKDYFSKGLFFTPNSKEPLPPEEATNLYQMLYDGDIKYKADKQGIVQFQNKKGVTIGNWKPLKTEATPYETEIGKLKAQKEFGTLKTQKEETIKNLNDTAANLERDLSGLITEQKVNAVDNSEIISVKRAQLQDLQNRVSKLQSGGMVKSTVTPGTPAKKQYGDITGWDWTTADIPATPDTEKLEYIPPNSQISPNVLQNAPKNNYAIGQILSIKNKNWKIVGFFPDGEPDIVKVK